MTYRSWFDDFAKRHQHIVQKLRQKGYTKEQIINYFDFENMLQHEPNFCPLYQELNEAGTQGKKCHDMERLNCYLCACPHFRFNDAGIDKIEKRTRYSLCDIDSKEGSAGVYGEMIHQDCSGCRIPHHLKYIQKHYDEDWKVIMKQCQSTL